MTIVEPMQLLPFDKCETLRVSADVIRNGELLEFTYDLSGDTSDAVIPPPESPERRDGLWQATCFEAFIAAGKSSYIELNFAPSRQWAAYQFTNYRQGMRDLDIEPPHVRFINNRLVASLNLKAKAGAPLNLTAVIEHGSGARSYWALAHPGGNRPDFHARDCFVAKLP
jgi:hypothetical protein